MMVSFDGLSRSCIKWKQVKGDGPKGYVSRCSEFEAGRKIPKCPPAKVNKKYGPTLRSQDYIRKSGDPSRCAGTAKRTRRKAKK